MTLMCFLRGLTQTRFEAGVYANQYVRGRSFPEIGMPTNESRGSTIQATSQTGQVVADKGDLWVVESSHKTQSISYEFRGGGLALEMYSNSWTHPFIDLCPRSSLYKTQ